ncbi:MAG: glycosyltransferase family 2 protein [Methylobacter sp.]
MKDKTFELDSRYSTTRIVSKQEPLLEKSLANKIHSSLYSTTQSAEKTEGGLRKHGYFKYTLPNQPLISVITVVYNGERYLEQTIQSVINQTYNNIEYIIIDGYSSDLTVKIIEQYEDRIDYWVSEPDKGIADAMNKGLSFATGEYIAFINADDYLENIDCFDKVISQLDNNDIFICSILFGPSLKRLYPRGFNFLINFKNGVYHQGALCKKSVFNKIGGFDTKFKTNMDYDFFLRAYRYGVTGKNIPIVLSVMRDTGISSKRDWSSLSYRFSEEKNVHKKNCNSWLMNLTNKVFWLLYLNYRRLIYLIN